jgi:hypothetical protein
MTIENLKIDDYLIDWYIDSQIIDEEWSQKLSEHESNYLRAVLNGQVPTKVIPSIKNIKEVCNYEFNEIEDLSQIFSVNAPYDNMTYLEGIKKLQNLLTDIQKKFENYYQMYNREYIEYWFVNKKENKNEK